tara:strand:+ start:2601 stop:3191 length:591 start_codon:yes stop_codon:yes gene_type:complete
MLRKVKLYGKLAEFVGYKEFEVEASTVGKAVSFLIHNFPELESYMSPKYYQVKVGDSDIDKEEIHYPIGKEDIHFVPVIQGAGSGTGKFLLGALLVGVGFAVGGGVFGAALAKNIGAISFVKNVGFALALGGVSQMLSPTPEPQQFNSEADPQLSFSFSGVQNTSRAGTPIPIVYGEIFTGSLVISAAIDTNEVQA